jgi:dipeptidyl aminopeptidase/acylaminoacyl peptidase
MFRSYLIGACALLACMSALAQTQTPTQQLLSVTVNKPLPVSEYVKLPNVLGPVLSPDGNYLALRSPVNGRMNLAVVDVRSRKGTALTNFDNFDVVDVVWASNERLLFSLGNLNAPTGAGEFEGGGLFLMSRDGKESRVLSPTVRQMRSTGQRIYRPMDFLKRIPGNPDEVLVEASLRDANSVDVYRLNLKNGRTTLVTQDRPTYSLDWILDNNLVPRVVRSWVKDTQTYITHYRAGADAPWQELARVDQTKGPMFKVIDFMSDNKTLLVASNAGRDTMAVYKYDPEAKKLGELLASHPRYDLGADASGDEVPGVILEPDTDRLLGFSVSAERPQRLWQDERNAKLQAMIDGALPNVINRFTRFPNSSRVLVTSFSDVSPTTWYLLDEEKKTLEELFTSRPWLKGHLVEQRPFTFKTRDGLEIPGYYFLPKGHKPGDRLPTVIHIHGGPAVRADEFADGGFGYSEAQILASRGYAVILPNFRVTPGFGSKVYYSGFGTMGRQMSEDHEDAVQWGVKEGFVDPARVCMSGASYGGYATLVALAKTPEMFKCGVAGLVVSDWALMAVSPNGDTADSPAAVEFFKALAGQQGRGNDVLNAVSPVNMAAKMKAPLFMYAGLDDVRTPIEQTSAMRRALESAGRPPEVVIVKKEEGHGFGRVDSRTELYEQMLTFFDRHIGSGSPSK